MFFFVHISDFLPYYKQLEAIIYVSFKLQLHCQFYTRTQTYAVGLCSFVSDVRLIKYFSVNRISGWMFCIQDWESYFRY